MKPLCTMLGLFAMGFFAVSARPQSSVTTSPQTPPEDASFFLNQPVAHPEALSGVWETSTSNGGTIGIHLNLMTTVSGDADPPGWTPQSWQNLALSVFEQKNPEITFGDENYFSDSLRGGGVILKDGQIQLHFASSHADVPSVDLDLVQQPGNCWHGRFHRGSFDSVVTLCRPAPEVEGPSNPLVGTWSNDFVTRSCIHIVESGPGNFIGWSDALQIPGWVRFARNIPGPHQLLQNYGELAKVHAADNGEISLEFGAYNAICCSHKFIGKLSSDGTALRGEFPPGLNQAQHAEVFTKMRGDSCVDPAAFTRKQSNQNPHGTN